MKTHKTVFRYYTIMEYEKEQEWLSRQHRQGWKLTAAAACFYRFERCAPEDLSLIHICPSVISASSSTSNTWYIPAPS